MCDKWYENLYNGKLTGVVFLDIRETFDSVDHNIFLNKMKTQFGFTNIELELVSVILDELRTGLPH